MRNFRPISKSISVLGNKFYGNVLYFLKNPGKYFFSYQKFLQKYLQGFFDENNIYREFHGRVLESTEQLWKESKNTYLEPESITKLDSN